MVLAIPLPAELEQQMSRIRRGEQRGDAACPCPCGMAAGGDRSVLAGISRTEGSESTWSRLSWLEHPLFPSSCVTTGGMDGAITRAVPHTLSDDTHAWSVPSA